jgi:hypothetical protein
MGFFITTAQKSGNVREIKAAVNAAKKCHEEFPYFEERYQERGRSFAKSDAAWLATLALLVKEIVGIKRDLRYRANESSY